MTEGLSKRVQPVLEKKKKVLILNTDCQACKNYTNSVFALQTAFSLVPAHKSVNRCT